jgi:hypothetical protein
VATRPLTERYSQLAASKAELLSHPIYTQVRSLERIRIFMESHVFAVWDFMSLLKRLQRDLTCTTVPWSAPRDPRSARLVNEIVLAEESDTGPDGSPVSHLGLYLAAMEEVGAETHRFRQFSRRLLEGATVEQALCESAVPAHVRSFVGTTMAVACHGSTEEVVAVFLYGREDVIPEIFSQFLRGVDGKVDAPHFKYYLERHIEIDSESHGPAAAEILGRSTCADSAIEAAAFEAAQCAIRARIDFFTGIERSFAASSAA